MFRKMPLILLCMIGVTALCFPWMSESFASILYAISASLKSSIFFLLPFVIFALLCKTAISLARQASLWIGCILAMICLSNFCSTMMSYLVGNLSCHFVTALPNITKQSGLAPFWDFSLPKLISNSYAMFLGLILGVTIGYKKGSLGETVQRYLDKFLSYALNTILYMVPVSIAGFMVKMLYEGTLSQITKSYLPIFFWVATAVFAYISFLYFLSSRGQGKSTWQSIKNMLPAAVAGFGSMSSVAAMPLTLVATKKNSQRPDVAASLIPATVNIHLIGDCFAIPIFAFAIIKTFGIEIPSFSTYLVFALYFVLAKFSVAAIPGGGIIIMLPILETYLGFQGEMLTLITTLYILFDPLITSANVLGNGAFALLAEKLLGKRLQKDSL